MQKNWRNPPKVLQELPKSCRNNKIQGKLKDLSFIFLHCSCSSPAGVLQFRMCNAGKVSDFAAENLQEFLQDFFAWGDLVHTFYGILYV